MNSGGMGRIDKQTLLRFWRIAKPFFVSEMRWKALGLMALLVALSFALSGLNVLRSYVDRDFMSALALRNRETFFHQLYLYLALFSTLTPVAVFYRFTEERFALMWRNWLCKYMIGKYFTDRAYYHIDLEQSIDNPDQRLEEDVRSFAVSSLSFALIFFNSAVTLVAFIGILWSISTVLPAAAVIYAVLGSIATYLLGRPLISLNFAQLRKEANLRYKLVNVRDHAESIAFYSGEGEESKHVRNRLRDAIDNMRAIIGWNRNVGFFTHMYNYVHAILPIVLVAPLYLNGQIEFGVITQAAGAFGQVLGALSIIVVHFSNLSSLAAVVNRLGTFDSAVTPEYARRDKPGKPRIAVSRGNVVRFENATIMTPRGNEVLIRDLSFSLDSIKSLLICGPSGSGKSSLLRVLGGLWESGTGRLQQPPTEDMMFLPQRPYLILGTLRAQLYYPRTEGDVSQQTLWEAIRQVGLEPTINRVGGLDAEMDWGNVLSVGERQLIAFVRLALRKPPLALLDEATSALDKQIAQKLYAMVHSFAEHYVSVGLRADLEKYHESVLQLDGQGGWELEQAKRL